MGEAHMLLHQDASFPDDARTRLRTGTRARMSRRWSGSRRSATHAQGVANRDIKAGNLLTEDGTAKVIALGIAQAMQSPCSAAAGRPRGRRMWQGPPRSPGDRPHYFTMEQLSAKSELSLARRAGGRRVHVRPPARPSVTLARRALVDDPEEAASQARMVMQTPRCPAPLWRRRPTSVRSRSAA